MSLKLSGNIKSIIITILVLTIVFAFNDGRESLMLALWLKNFFYILLLTSISFLVLFLGFKLAAKYYDGDIEIRLSYITRFGFARGAQMEEIKIGKKIKVRRIYLGIIVSLLTTLLSYGKAFFTQIYSFETESNRLGHRWRNITQFQEAIIVIAGLAASLILLVIFKSMHIEKGVLINTWLIAWNLLPLGNLPGSKIFFGSRTLYVLAVAFFGFTLFLLPVLPITITILLALLFALTITIFYFTKIEYIK